MMFQLNGKRALITGASGGIGQSIATALYTQGATVGLCGTRVDVLENLAKQFDPERVTVFPAHLDTPQGPEKLIQSVEEKWKGLDILVNNAGLTQDNLMIRMKDTEWDQVIAVNLTAVFKLCREVLKPMMKQRWGRIINISSIVGVTGNPGQTNYVASKAGLIGLGKALAAEVASRGITVNCVAPGFIDTPMTEKLSATQKEKLLAEIPLGHMGTGPDIAAGVVYLSSQEAAYITGQTLHINGGLAML